MTDEIVLRFEMSQLLLTCVGRRGVWYATGHWSTLACRSHNVKEEYASLWQSILGFAVEHSLHLCGRLDVQVWVPRGATRVRLRTLPGSGAWLEPWLSRGGQSVQGQ